MPHKVVSFQQRLHVDDSGIGDASSNGVGEAKPFLLGVNHLTVKGCGFVVACGSRGMHHGMTPVLYDGVNSRIRRGNTFH